MTAQTTQPDASAEPAAEPDPRDVHLARYATLHRRLTALEDAAYQTRRMLLSVSCHATAEVERTSVGRAYLKTADLLKVVETIKAEVAMARQASKVD